MKITWLGTGGGRIVVINQLRASGGWVLEMADQIVHVDPGPGALVRAKQYGVKFSKLTGVVVSHAHPDHYTDAEMVIEGMTDYTRKKRGFLVCNETVIKGDGKNYSPVISPYHLNLLETCRVMEPGDVFRAGELQITATKTEHGEKNCLGFVFKGEGRTLGFSGDGEYFEGQPKQYKGCDYLLVNCLRPRDDKWPQHMNAEGAMKLIQEVKPKMAMLQHFGMNMLRGTAEREAGWIQEQTGIRTMAAKDGMKLDFEGKGKAKALGGFFENTGPEGAD
jgi:ribonuclease BN (tRNA processing enzyme)